MHSDSDNSFSVYNGKSKGLKIYKNVVLGKGAIIEGPVIIGMPPRSHVDGELKTIIGDNCIIRPFTVIYAGNRIGDNLQTGQGVTIRENNQIGDNVSIGTNSSVEIDNVIGNNVRIHTGCFLEMTNIGNNVFLAPHVVFTDDPHPMCPRYKECVGGAIVKDRARLGANVTVLPGVIIGENSLIGAGSVVVNEIAKNIVAAGNPAKPIKNISDLDCFKGFFKRPYIWE